MSAARPSSALARLVLSGALAITVACRKPDDSRPVEGSAEVVVATQTTTPVASLGPEAEVDEGSSPTTLRTPATRPDVLLAHVPANASRVALLDVAALRRLVTEVVAPLNDPAMGIASAITALRRLAGDAPALGAVDWARAPAAIVAQSADGLVVIVAATAVDGAPEPGASIGQGARRITRVGDVALLGDESAVQAASAGGYAVPQSWPGWRQLAGDAAITVVIDDVAQVPEAVRAELGFVRDGSRLGLAVGVDGEVRLVYAAVDDAATRRALGRGQAFANAALGIMRSEANPALEPWVAWLGAIERALWSRIAIESVDGVVVLRFAEADCGGPLANLAALGVISALVRAGAVDGAAPDIDFAPVGGAVAEGCEPLGSQPARLPRSLARLGEPDPGVAGALVLFDQAAILRNGLPTAFGLLPFALSRQALVQAFGSGPFGFDDFTTEEGSGAWHVGAGPSNRWRHAVVLHPGAAALVRGGPVLGLASANLEGAFALFTPLVDVELRLGSTEASLWSDAAQHAAVDSSLAVVLNGALIARLAGGLENNELLAAIASSGWVLFDLGAPDGARVVFEATDAAARLPALRDAIAPALMAVIDKSQSQVPLDPTVRAVIESAIGDAVDRMRFEAIGDRVEVSAGPNPVATLGEVAVRVLFPVLGGSIQRGPVEFPGGRNPWATP